MPSRATHTAARRRGRPLTEDVPASVAGSAVRVRLARPRPRTTALKEVRPAPENGYRRRSPRLPGPFAAAPSSRPAVTVRLFDAKLEVRSAD